MKNETKETNLTGYPSIDKPWLKYYSEEAIHAKVPECSIYEYLYENNKEHLDDKAINYEKRWISYRELFLNIDKVANVFYAEGIREGDIVTIIAPAIPEVIYLFYALSKIGAVSNFIDPRKSVDEVAELPATATTKACVVLDSLWDKFYGIFVEKCGLLVALSISDSLTGLTKTVMKLKTKKVKREIVSFSDLLIRHETGKRNDFKALFKPDTLALLEYTGGTTGKSKGVMLSNENVNSVIEQIRYSGIPIKRGESWLSVAFPFIAYSLVCSIHLPLALGVKACLCFDLDVKKVEQKLRKMHINHMSNTPMMWEELTKSKVAAGMNFGFLITPIVGADGLKIQKEKEINEFLEEHNCQYRLLKGYGMTEVASAVCVTPNNEINKLRSVGIPFCYTKIGIFSENTMQELSYGQQGEICICGPSVMLGYYNNETASKEVLKIHSDGYVWMHSGDLGHIDQDGFLYIDGRIKRMLIDYTGFKIYTTEIESVIYEHPKVSKCCVVGAKDTVHNQGEVPIAYVVAKEKVDINNLKAEIFRLCKEKLPLLTSG